jgi:outer membrane protein assembly factor BamB
MHISRFTPRAAAAALLLAAGLAGAGDWPRFRGPNGTGVADDKGVPVKWAAADGVLWKTPIPGRGNSSPVVSGGRVFLQSASADGRERLLLCLDAGTGEILWTRAAPGGPARTHPRNTPASGTPAADGGRVFATSWDGKDLALLAYDFDGKLLWRRGLGPFASQHGAGHSPVVHDGKVILANDQDGSAALLAFDAKTGEPAWQAKRKAYRACYSTPFVREAGGGPELVVASTAGVTGYEPRTGAETWHCDWPSGARPLRTVASPVFAAGLVIACAGDGDGSRHLIAVRPGGTGGRAAVVWEDRKSFPYVPTPLAWGEHLLSVTDAGVAACHVAATGEEVWSHRLGEPVTASPVLADGKVYVAGEGGDVFVFPAATSFTLLAKNALGEPVMATPAVADGRLYVRGAEHLFCVGRPGPDASAKRR